LVSQFYDAQLRPAGLRMTQFSVLALLGGHGDQTMSKLAEVAGMDRTTLTRNIGLLRKRGWVRTQRGEDPRERVAGLTPKGWETLRQGFPYWRQAHLTLQERMGVPDFAPLLGRIGQVVEAAMKF
jgi:DNA-binding MarR family transcriptional regulator